MPMKPPKQKPIGRPGKLSRNTSHGRAAKKMKASADRDGRQRKTKHDGRPRERETKQARLSQSPAELPARPLAPPAPAPAEQPFESVQKSLDELLKKLAKLTFEYEQAVHDNVVADRQALHPELLYTARILRAAVVATQLGDHEWLKAQDATAATFLAKHRASQRSTRYRGGLPIYSRPEAVRHLKRFVIQTLKEALRDGRWTYDVIPVVANRIAEVIVGNLLGGGAVELAWEFLPELRPELHDDASTRARVASKIIHILERSTASNIEATAEAIVRRVLSSLSKMKTKGLFDLDRKAQAALKTAPAARRGSAATSIASGPQAERQATAESTTRVPPSKRNE